MRALGIIGVILIVVGAVVVALRGISYVKDRDTARVGPVSVTAETKGFITPLAGVIAVGVGIVLVVADRGRKAA